MRDMLENAKTVLLLVEEDFYRLIIIILKHQISIRSHLASRSRPALDFSKLPHRLSADSRTRTSRTLEA
jgi:hypothetical protein